MRNGGRRAFTTIELMVVMIIMVLMCSIVVVSMGPALGEARLRSGCRMISSVLNYARSYAVTRQTYTRVVFDRARNGLQVQAYVRTGTPEERMEPLTTQPGRFRKLPRGVEVSGVHTVGIEEEQNLVGYSMSGESDETVITVRDPRGRERAITVDAITGRAAVVVGQGRS